MSEQTPEREALPDDEAKVFLSYSRKDRERAQSIADALRSRNFGVFKDTDDILPTEEWRTRLEELIQEADTIVFLLSPHSAASEVCAWEVEYATSLNKRIAPIVIDDVEGDAIPPLLARLNFIFCTPRDPFENAVATLVSALSTDIDWIREHTRINGLARRWTDAGKPVRLLPRGQDITDMERWRDAHPADAPAVLPIQSSYIAAARAAAGRRQRNWIAGAIATTAVTAGIAVFAYFQSVEADAQRIAAVENAAEADRQRMVAEANAVETAEQRAIAVENAAEAERQRALAEEQRRSALRQLAGDRLRAGNRAAAVRALVEAGAPSEELDPLLAGLVSAANGATPDIVPRPWYWNGELRLNMNIDLDNMRGDLVPIAPFPAKFSTWADSPEWAEYPVIISETGANRVMNEQGETLAESPSGRPFIPCFTDRPEGDRPEGNLTIFGVGFYGYSACSMTLIEMSVPVNGPITRTDRTACEGASVSFSGEAIPVDTVLQHCADATQSEFLEPLEGAPNLWPLFRIAENQFPRTRPEADLWRAFPAYTPAALTDAAIREVDRLKLPPADSEEIGVRNFSGDSAGGRYLPEVFKGKTMTVLASITAWGGTGGEEDMVCTGPRRGEMTCTRWHGFGGYGGFAIDEARARVAVYGEALTKYDKNDTGTRSNLWLIPEPAAAPIPVEGLDAYGMIIDADFGNDGRLAILTTAAVILFDPASGALDILGRSDGTLALRWGKGGEVVTMSATNLTFLRPGSAPTRLPFVLGPLTETGPYEATRKPWLARDNDGGMLAIGIGPDFQLFDTELRAPVSGIVTVPDTQLGHASGTVRLERGPKGGVELNLNLQNYVRSGRAKGDVADFLDPEAPFRQ